MNIAIISICSQKYKPLGDATYPHWQAYCDKHGYQLIVDDASDPRGCNWQKICMVGHHVKLYDLVLWVGADTIPTNSEIKIEQFWLQQGTPSILLTADVLGINSDVMLFAKGVMSEMFTTAANSLYSWYKTHPFYEQEAINRFAYQSPYREVTKIIPQKGMNSYMNNLYGRNESWPGNWSKGDWILHLPGLPNDTRIAVIKELESKGEIV